MILTIILIMVWLSLGVVSAGFMGGDFLTMTSPDLPIVERCWLCYSILLGPIPITVLGLLHGFNWDHYHWYWTYRKQLHEKILIRDGNDMLRKLEM